ncbi:TRAP transporter substrate-binding protein [Tistrella mobilis]|uniref:Bacterial extracellular solute-binding protein, family 7 n=1 Tax=Tistrella mobilis (strain KA081020-065) TaxID=1110502 RepID=I3TL09_TISMK|nr:TRAP transporter substrate-binding protein [Tistrella mobilis]AFK53447.1 Bacterial extracellular solute-binding protein, family 7 [Tistrella mobilis KA081020-065]
MDRRSFLKGSAAAGAAAAAVAASNFPAPAIAQGKIEWRMVTSWPKNFPGLGTAAESIAQKITTMSGGRLTVKVFAAGELVPAFGAFDAVQQGAAEIYHSAAYYYGGKHPGFHFFTTAPYGLYAAEQFAWWAIGDGEKLQDELYAPFGVKAFPAVNTCAQAVGWFAKEINTPDDLKGLKFRTAGLNAEIFRRLGCNVVQLPGGEIFQAMQSGTVDAADWVGPWNDLAFGLHRVAKNYYTPGIGEPSATIEMGIGKKHWDELPDDLKAIVRQAAYSDYQEGVGQFIVRNSAAVATLINEHGVKVRPFPDPVYKALGDAAESFINELSGGGDDILKRIVKSYYTFRNNSMTWQQHAEQPYLNIRAAGPKFAV